MTNGPVAPLWQRVILWLVLLAILVGVVALIGDWSSLIVALAGGLLAAAVNVLRRRRR